MSRNKLHKIEAGGSAVGTYSNFQVPSCSREFSRTLFFCHDSCSYASNIPLLPSILLVLKGYTNVGDNSERVFFEVPSCMSLARY